MLCSYEIGFYWSVCAAVCGSAWVWNWVGHQPLSLCSLINTYPAALSFLLVLDLSYPASYLGEGLSLPLGLYCSESYWTRAINQCIDENNPEIVDWGTQGSSLLWLRIWIWFWVPFSAFHLLCSKKWEKRWSWSGSREVYFVNWTFSTSDILVLCASCGLKVTDSHTRWWVLRQRKVTYGDSERFFLRENT